MAPTALIVDDDAGFRRVAGRLLAARGFVVVAQAEDGARGLAAARLHHPHCVLLDVHLPDGPWLPIARAMLSGSAPVPRILVTSTEPSAVAEAEVVAAGVVGFVAKDRLVGADLVALFGLPTP
ncbi:response regulator [Amycolatopsis rhabdoformis]|uniref:Response regulator n=1 Tax=Amycolatopsis rhabdoformis TaxID=1448059 RepID=A0ABZ1IBC3_9PSEU|nr:response regulator [Amycolatopsis rhabdoformis]WSE31771.1 response regulator [Amycolatopsis rhabdoformis]